VVAALRALRALVTQFVYGAVENADFVMAVLPVPLDCGAAFPRVCRSRTTAEGERPEEVRPDETVIQ
jgi:hypothetical protein